MRFAYIALVATLCLSACTYSRNDRVLGFHQDGSKKPHLTVLPVYQKDNKQIPWTALEHFSDAITARLINTQNLVIERDTVHTALVQELTNSPSNLFINENAISKEVTQGQEFLAFVELVQHEIFERTENTTFLEKITPSCTLELSMRVKVIDVRLGKPKVILQEIIHQSHAIPKPFTKISLYEAFWKKKTYSLSPMGLAHNQFCKEVAHRMEEYILLAKSL